MKKMTSAVALAAALAAGFMITANAQTPAPAAPAEPAAAAGAVDLATTGLSPAQVRKGTTLFNDNCANCHGDTLGGLMENPPLIGADFQSYWFGQPASNLYAYIATNMPLDRPGAMTPDEYAAITAYVLRRNGIAATEGAPDLVGDEAALAAVTLPPPAAQ